MTEQINTPELRFLEFKDEWYQSNLDEMCSFTSGGTPSRKINKYWDGDIPWITTSDLNNKFIKNIFTKITSSGLKNSSAKLITEPAIILAMYGQGKTRGKCSILNFPATTNQACAILQPNEFNNIEFVYQFLEKNYTYLRAQSNEGSQKNLSLSLLKKIKINYPSLFEQNKISDFFSKLDRQIELEEQKLEKLEEQKKGYMQKIFSQKLRFKDENGSDYPNWEEVQLKDILIRRDHKQVPEINAPLMSFTSTGGIEPKGDRYNREFLVKNKNKKYKRTEFNDLIYSSNNLDVGAIGLNRYGTSVISDVYEVFKIEEQVSPYFIEMSILQPEFMYKILRYRQGALYGQYRIHANDFLKINIELPCSEEQYKIGDFVNKLDNIIDIINNKIELLKQRKRGFLQKMFI
ncbi:restriction endonuclease subunit S [Staphylococcus pettenkoferi]|uniref:restriction endonuclease subunit S n=1 Tax=Staphylococcus pettenkoferi TaxID=170573 RepID=UPI00119DCDC9|nr:restriction endonuclease subunit S [Staphylococcus pettenkoferi]